MDHSSGTIRQIVGLLSDALSIVTYAGTVAHLGMLVTMALAPVAAGA
ncbi:hypothetical protein [Pelagivirga sediminicola]|nr:hypothetical protein [Pelagivirga sediminicola]